MTEEVVINEISRKFENKYKTREDDFRDSSNSRQNNNGQNQKRWQSYDTRRSFGNSQKYHQQQINSDMDQWDFQSCPDSMTNRQESEVQASSYQPNVEHQTNVITRNDDSTRRGNRNDHNQSSILRSGYTQIMVNPMLLSDLEFTHWMEKLVEARRNRQEKRPRPYRNYRKPYNNEQSEQRRPQLKSKMQPAHELDIQSIMNTFNCEYDDIVEAVDLYNLDVEESQSA